MSELLRPQQYGDEIDEEAEGHRACEGEMQRHRLSRVAQADERDRQQEETGEHRQPDEIGHRVEPRAAGCGVGTSASRVARKVSRAKAGRPHKDFIKTAVAASPRPAEHIPPKNAARAEAVPVERKIG
jgi:hypothetical protein